MALTHAERLLQELGITQPDEIDLEAIAFHVGARVRYRPLEGCEARIVGVADQAIITVKADSNPRRQRFSIAHELGHWYHHRGQCLVCRAEDTGPGGTSPRERAANTYAADLLMPAYLFRPLAAQHAKTNLKAINSLADVFQSSQTATAIRLVENDHNPAMLVCHGPNGRKWFARAPSVPQRWFPQVALDPDSFALDVLYGRAPENANPRKIGADAWFDRREAERFEIHEQSWRTGPNEILTLLLIGDEEMLEDS
jgi:Zn-dependent peptidase ImmA (M78 family)